MQKLSKSTRKIFHNRVESKQNFGQHRQFTSKNDTKNFKINWKVISGVAVITGFSLYQYHKSKSDREKSDTIVEENVTAVQEIIDAIKGGWEVDEMNDITIFDHIWTTLVLTFRVSYIMAHFSPLICTFPLTYLSSTFTTIWYTTLLYVFRLCGPTFIKLGQWMATRPDLFPDDLCRTLEGLHSIGGMHSHEDNRRMIRQAFGREIEEIFVDFDPVPVASGGIAQVHKAKIRQGDSIIDVAVKIRHPGIEKSIAQDLRIIQNITAFIGDFESYKWLNLEGNVLTFAKSMKEQIDLRVEANNLTKFIHNFKEIDNVIFPTPIPKLSHPLVLVETWEQGTPINEFFHQNTKDEAVSKKLASLGVVLYLKMMMDNFLHSDLHPGNITVRLDENKNPSLVVLDVGLVAKLKQRDRVNLISLFTAIATNEGYTAAECMIEKTQKAYISKDAIKNFKSELGEFFSFLADPTTPEVEIGLTFQKALELGKKYKVAIDSTMATALIGTMVIEGLGRQLNPSLDFITEATPVLTMSKDFTQEYFKRRLSKFVSQSADTIKEEVEKKANELTNELRKNDWW